MRKQFILAISLLTTLFLVTLQVQALEINLGEAAKYNAFVKNDFSNTGSDIQGRLAVGGNLKVNQFDVGVKINAFGMESGPTLVVGGNVEKIGNAGLNVYGTDGAANSGDLVYAGSVSGAHVNGNLISKNKNDLPVGFANAFTYLEQLSTDLMAVTASGTTALGKYNGPLVFDATSTPTDNIYVFNVTQEQITSNTNGGWDVSGVSNDATIVFNIISNTGKVSLTSNIGLSINGKSVASFDQNTLTGRPDQQVLFNFANATKIDLATTLYGSVLAPTADISASTQPIWGQVIAKSWQSDNLQINYDPFTAVGKPSGIVDVPEPATLWLFVLAFLFMLVKQQGYSFNVLQVMKRVFSVKNIVSA